MKTPQPTKSSDHPLNDIWKDQKEFNANFFPDALTFEEKSRQTKELVLHMMSELDELLRCGVWKPHRREDKQVNFDQITNELTDILKYWISLCLVWEKSPSDMLSDYWRKSMVCRQRYSEEFALSLQGRIVICDIDGVLADYCEGLTTWIEKNIPELKNIRTRLGGECWIDADAIGVSDMLWKQIKHTYRTTRGKLEIPAFPCAADMLRSLKHQGYQIILLTSRPIDQYPNIYTDTLEWLKNNHMTFDAIWWSSDKREKILEKCVRPNIAFAIDDDPKYVQEYARLSIPCIWIDHLERDEAMSSLVKRYAQKVTSVQQAYKLITEKIKEIDRA